NRGLPQRVGHLFLDDSTEDQRLPVFGPQVSAEIAGVEQGATQDGLPRHDGRGFRMNSQLDISEGVYMRSDFENDTHVFIPDGGILSADLRNLSIVRDRHLLADKKPAGLIVPDINLGLGQNGGVGGLAQELDEEIHADGTLENPGAQRSQSLRQRARGRGVDGRWSPKSLRVLTGATAQYGI